MSVTAQPPAWQLDTIFRGIESDEYRRAWDELRQGTEDLDKLLSRRESTPDTATDSHFVERSLEQLENVYNLGWTLFAFLKCKVDSDSSDDVAKAELSRLAPLQSRVTLLEKRFAAMLRPLNIELLSTESADVKKHKYFLQRSQTRANFQMDRHAEELAAVLNDTGARAWHRLQATLVATDTIRVALAGTEEKEYTHAELRLHMSVPDRETRRVAFRGLTELADRSSTVYAAALNSVKGQVIEVAKRQGWKDPLAESLFTNAISSDALEAMRQACLARLPDFRRFLKAKAELLGLRRLEWHDLWAPVQLGENGTYGWPQVEELVVESFASFSDSLASFAKRAFAEGWVDAGARKHKTAGAYCMPIMGRRESRILINFGAQLYDVLTLAHELGHGFHGDCFFRSGKTVLQSGTPMTLAETASTFCETVMLNSLLRKADEKSRLGFLAEYLTSATLLVVEMDTRFRFEHSVFAGRREREFSVDELKRLMLESQQENYGEVLDESAGNPYSWAIAPHYFLESQSYYNYPYTFGMLFSLGLYRVFEDQPNGFQGRYESMLSRTGMADPRDLALEFGADIEDPEFWNDSLSVIIEKIDEFELLVQKRALERQAVIQ